MTQTKVLQFEFFMAEHPFGTAMVNGKRLDFVLKGRSLVVSDNSVTEDERHQLVREIAEFVRKSWMPV